MNYLWHLLLPNLKSTLITSLLFLSQIPTLPNEKIPQEKYYHFSDWCLNYSELDPEEKTTVEALMKQGLTAISSDSNVSWKIAVNTDKCFEVEEALLDKKSLDFSNDEYSISDLAPIATLRELKELNLEQQRINDLSPLSALSQLEKLDLSRNRINNLAPLNSLLELKELDLGYNLIHFLTPLSSLTKLEELNIEHSVVSDLEALSSLINLRQLNLSFNRINNVEPLVSLYNLKKLNLSRNRIQSIRPLASLTNLVQLKIEDNYIPLEAQICPSQQRIVCNDLYDQRIADNFAEEENDLLQTQQEILENYRRILKEIITKQLSTEK